VSLVSSLPPRFSKEEVKKYVYELYGLSAKVNPLVSDIGQNFHIVDKSGKEFVFKIANPEENKEMLDMQNKAMGHLSVNNKSINSPMFYKTVMGEEIVRIKNKDDLSYNARMLTYLPGIFLADVNDHSSDLLLTVMCPIALFCISSISLFSSGFAILKTYSLPD
jgi:Ser/Thr protein kinase RdoA (MazF antagonist)